MYGGDAAVQLVTSMCKQVDTLQARLETYERKLTKVEREKWLQEHRPSLSVDVAGANRFISAAIPELTSKQKHALRVVSGALLLWYCSTAACVLHGDRRCP